MSDLYPASPAATPDEFWRPPAAYRRQVVVAAVGLGLFILVYLALTGWFAYTAYRLLAGVMEDDARPLRMLAGACAAFVAVFLGKAVFFFRRSQQAHGLEVVAGDQPELFQFLQRLADEAGAPRPHKVFLSGDVNAAVFYDLSMLNLLLPSRKNLVIGLPLVNALTLGELKAVLAHEFGHFAQRSMRLGVWAGMAQQIAGRLVVHRDALDGFLQGLSRTDPRIAWIGWALRLVVWSIRSLLDTLLRMVVLAQRALTREMEFQADRVAVALTGSDQLVHALHKLPAADAAWDRACSLAVGEVLEGRRPHDLFAVHREVLRRMAEVLDDPHFGRVPPLPSSDPASHRVFRAGMARPPQMWATHPDSADREERAKQRYLPSPLDERSAWELFDQADRWETQLIEQMFPPRRGNDSAAASAAAPAAAAAAAAALVAESEPAATLAPPTTLPAGDLQKACARMFDAANLRPQYRGAYLSRTPTRYVESPNELYRDAKKWDALDREALVQQLDGLYPPSLAEDLARWRALEEEHAALQGLWDGTLQAPDGVVRFRGEEIRRRELPQLMAQVRGEVDQARQAVLLHDARCRALHLAAARRTGQWWDEYLQGLAALLHYAEHVEADLQDAYGALGNVFAVVTADGAVSSSERSRLVKSATGVHQALEAIFAARADVFLDARVREKLAVDDWAASLGTCGLPQPHWANIGEWLEALPSWVRGVSHALSSLRLAALELLLSAEAQVARALRSGETLGHAPAPSRAPGQYARLLPGQERPRQRKLGWWDRFQTADGAAAAALRLAVAVGIIGAVIALAILAERPAA